MGERFRPAGGLVAFVLLVALTALAPLLLTGCASGIVLAVIAAAAAGGGGGGGGGGGAQRPLWAITGARVSNMRPASGIQEADCLGNDSPKGCPCSAVAAEKVEEAALAAGLAEYAAETVQICFRLKLVNRDVLDAPPTTADVILRLRVEGGQDVEVPCGALEEGMHTCEWPSEGFALDREKTVTVFFQADQNTGPVPRVAECDGEAASGAIALAFVLDNRPLQSLADCCVTLPCDPNLTGNMEIQPEVLSIELTGATRIRAVIVGDELVAVGTESISQTSDSPHCSPDGVAATILRSELDTEQFNPTAFGESEPVHLALAITDGRFRTGEPFRSRLFFCCNRHFIANNKHPTIDPNIKLSSLPRADEGANAFAGRVVVDYMVQDKGGEDYDLHVAVVDASGKTLAISPLKEASGDACDGPLDKKSDGIFKIKPSPQGVARRFIWNSDFDIDAAYGRLRVIGSSLNGPRFENLSIEVFAEDPTLSDCLEVPQTSKVVLPHNTIDNAIVHTVAGIATGQTSPGIAGDGEVVENRGKFETLAAAEFDSEGRLYLLDAGANIIWRADDISSSKTVLSRFAGTGANDPRREPDDFDGNRPSEAQFSEPKDIEIAADGTIYFIEDAGSALWRIDGGRELVLLMDPLTLRSPRRILLDESTDRLYVADTENCRVIEYRLDDPVNRNDPPADVILGEVKSLRVGEFLAGFFKGKGCSDVGADEIAARGINGCNYTDILEEFRAAGRCPGGTPEPSPRAAVSNPAGLDLHGRFLLVGAAGSDSSTGPDFPGRILGVNLDQPMEVAELFVQAPCMEIPVGTATVPPTLFRPTTLRVFDELDPEPHLYAVFDIVVRAGGGRGQGIIAKAKILDPGAGAGAPSLGPFITVAGIQPGQVIDCVASVNLETTIRVNDECLAPLAIPRNSPPNLVARLSRPSDMLIDPQDVNLLICDSRNQRLRKIGKDLGCEPVRTCDFTPSFDSSLDRISTVLGDGAEGRSLCESKAPTPCLPLQGLLGDPAIGNKLAEPTGLLLLEGEDGGEILFISDTLNNRIRALDLSTGLISTIAGRLKEEPERCNEDSPTFNGDGPASERLLLQPTALAVFPKTFSCRAGGPMRLYFADTGNHLIRAIDEEGRIETVAGRRNTTGGHPRSGDTDALINEQIGESPRDADQVFIKRPRGLAVDEAGIVLISDTGQHRILSLKDGMLRRVIGKGAGSDGTTEVRDPVPLPVPTDPIAIGDGGPPLQAVLWEPKEIAFDGKEEFLYIADAMNHRVRRVQYLGNGEFGEVIESVAGNGLPAAGGSTVPAAGQDALAFAISQPYGLVFDPSDASGRSLFLSEGAGTSRIYRVTLASGAGAHVLAIAAGSTIGTAGDGDTPCNAQFTNPRGLEIDADGNLYTADSRNHRVRRFFPGTCRN